MGYNKETGMYEGYIYCIENLIDHMKYIGQTSQTIGIRWSGHKRACKEKQNYHLYNAMNYYGIENFTVYELEKISKITKEELIDALNSQERKCIEKFDTYDNGYNNTVGGRDTNNQERSVRQYTLNGDILQEFKSIDSLKEYLNRDCVSSVYSCCHGEIKYAYGYVWRFSEDDINRYALPNSKEKREAIIRIKSQGKIYQYSLLGQLLYVYQNADEAVTLTNIKRSQIVGSCSGDKVTGGGYVWRFDGDDFQTIKSTRDKFKTVYQYDKHYKLLNMFVSTREASRKTGINRNSIGENCRGNQKTAGGFIFSYEMI